MNAALELVGTDVLPDTPQGTVCCTGMLGDVWSIPGFSPPYAVIPKSSDLTAEALQRYVDLVESGRLPLKIHPVYGFEEIAEAHRVMGERWGSWPPGWAEGRACRVRPETALSNFTAPRSGVRVPW